MKLAARRAGSMKLFRRLSFDELEEETVKKAAVEKEKLLKGDASRSDDAVLTPSHGAAGESRRLLLADGEVLSMQLSKDGATLFSGDMKHVIAWDVASGVRKQTLEADGAVRCLRLSPDGKTLWGGTDAKHVIAWAPLASGVS